MKSLCLASLSGFIALLSVLFKEFSLVAWVSLIPLFFSLSEKNPLYPVWFKSFVFSATAMLPLAVGFIPLSYGLFLFFGASSLFF